MGHIASWIIGRELDPAEAPLPLFPPILISPVGDRGLREEFLALPRPLLNSGIPFSTSWGLEVLEYFASSVCDQRGPKYGYSK